MRRAGKNTGKGGLRVVALFEALKGILVLVAGCGLLTFIHKDLHEVAVHLVRALHFNPAKHYPSVFIDAADRVTDFQLWMIALSALIYASVRLAEAYGLWKQFAWAEWFGCLSGAIYLPIEILEVSREFTWPRITILVVNLGVVGYLTDILIRTRRNGRR